VKTTWIPYEPGTSAGSTDWANTAGKSAEPLPRQTVTASGAVSSCAGLEHRVSWIADLSVVSGEPTRRMWPRPAPALGSAAVRCQPPLLSILTPTVVVFATPRSSLMAASDGAIEMAM
jgi:hypothetical protein